MDICVNVTAGLLRKLYSWSPLKKPGSIDGECSDPPRCPKANSITRSYDENDVTFHAQWGLAMALISVISTLLPTPMPQTVTPEIHRFENMDRINRKGVLEMRVSSGSLHSDASNDSVSGQRKLWSVCQGPSMSASARRQMFVWGALYTHHENTPI